MDASASPSLTGGDRTRQYAAILLGRFMLIAAVTGLAAGFLAIKALPDEGFELSPYLVVTWGAAVGLLLVTWRYDAIKDSIASLLIRRVRGRHIR